MASRLKSVWSRHLLQIQLITSESAEGVIMIDVNQEIKWANGAALAMHGVQSCGELGRTIDEYHAKFQIKFRGAPPPSSDRSVESVAAGESFRDVIIEVTPLQANRPEWIYRVRNLVLVDDAGHPTCIVLVVRRLQDQARQTEAFSARLDDLLGASALVRRSDQVFVGANDAFLRLTGLDAAELAGTSAQETALLSDAAADASVSLISLPESGRRVAITRVPVEHAGQPCVLYSALDVPSREAAQIPAGKLSPAAAAALCEASPAPLFILDSDMNVTAASQSWLDLLSYTPGEVSGRAITTFMTPASAAFFRTHTWHGFAQTPRPRDLKCDFVMRSGGIVKALVSASVYLDDDGQPEQVIAAPVDISERARTEDAFSTMFALSPVPMLIRKLDDTRILDANDAFVAVTGFDSASIVGHGTDEFGIFDNRAARQHFETAARSDDGIRNVDAHLKTNHGDVLDCLVSGSRIHAFGQTCLLIVLQDVSDRRRNETQLFQAIETVMEDTSWFSRSVIEKLATLRSPPRAGGKPAEIGDLTPREREVLGFISHGLADTDIAQKLGLTRSTVRNHVATLYSKIGVHSRSSAIIWARERGINMAWPSTPAANYARSPVPASKSGVVTLVAKTRRS